MSTALAELGHSLQLDHGALWLRRTKGDPYAALLCGIDEDVGPWHDRIRARGPLWRSALGTWVTADPRLGARLLDHSAVEHLTALPEAPAAQAVTPPDLGPLCARVIDAVGEEFDLVIDVAEHIAAETVAALCAVQTEQRTRFAEAMAAVAIAQDAVLCPQRLADTRRMHAALADLGEFLAVPGPPDGDTGLAVAVVGARTGADLVVRAVLRARLPGVAGRAGALVEETLREDPPVRLAPLVARTDLSLDGLAVTRGERITVVLDAVGAPLPGPVHHALTPLYRAMAEHTVAALADRFTALDQCGPPVSRPRAPVTRGFARVPVRTGARGKRR